MWMLMEGVALYLLLVKVFNYSSRNAILVFTILSYGMSAKCIPHVCRPLYVVLFSRASHSFSKMLLKDKSLASQLKRKKVTEALLD